MYENDENNNNNEDNLTFNDNNNEGTTSSDTNNNFYYSSNSNQSSVSSSNPYSTYNYSTYQQNQPVITPRKAKKEKKSGFKKFVAIVCSAVLFGVVAGAAFSVPTYLTKQELLKAQADYEKEISLNRQNITATGTLTTGETSDAPGSTIQQIASDCLPCVVSITNKGVTEVRTMFGTYKQDTESSGSGIIIGENATELLIVTNYHVVSGSNELSVVFSYDEASENPSLVSAKIKGYEEDKDLAVIAVSSKDITNEMRSQIKIATIGDSTKLALGQQVVAIGNALGYGQSVTTGIISALNREISLESDKGNKITNKLIQTDAAINPGNSGGALLNMQGQLIGINSAKMASSQIEGMGYAIPISDVQSIIEELMLKETRDVVDEKDRGYLGVQVIDVSSEITELYNLPTGAFVSAVYDDSPAAKAGITKNMIISKVDSQTIRTKEELVNTLSYYKAGETVNITVYVMGNNGYETRVLSVLLGDKNSISSNEVDDSGNQNREDYQNSTEESKNPYGNGGYDNGYYNFGDSWFNDFFWPFTK